MNHGVKKLLKLHEKFHGHVGEHITYSLDGDTMINKTEQLHNFLVQVIVLLVLNLNIYILFCQSFLNQTNTGNFINKVNHHVSSLVLLFIAVNLSVF